jgi:DNA-binding response OmpR family regulator
VPTQLVWSCTPARVAKWQTQRTQNPPPQGVPVQVRPRAQDQPQRSGTACRFKSGPGHKTSHNDPGHIGVVEHVFRVSSTGGPQCGDMKILVIEDEARLAISLRKGLTADGYTVELAGDGEQGLWIAQQQSFDAIVLDIMLPKLNGFAVCAALRKGHNWTPILMLTAKDGEHDIAEALDTGADDYLTKPFSLVVLTARLRALTRRGTGERPTVLAVDDLTLDPSRRRCQRGNDTINLTPTEFNVLEFLMRRAGQAVTKAEILSHAWDFAYDGDPNIVEVYVSSLRKKIDAPFGVKSLKTVWGVGYELSLEVRSPQPG